MKTFLASLIIAALILLGGCADSAVSADVSPASPESEREPSEPESLSPEKTAHSSDFRRGNNQNGILGKITAITGNTVTIAVGTLNRPENAPEDRGIPSGKDGSRSDGTPSRQERPEGTPPSRQERPEGDPSKSERTRDGSMPQRERPADANRRGPGGFPGGDMDLEYSGEEASYTLSDDIDITKGMGENRENLTISDLSDGDIVWLLLDEQEQPVSVQVFGTNE